MAASSSSTLNSIGRNRSVGFSSDSNYLAYSGPDGRLRIWDSSTGVLKQEYTPSSHLSAMCTCLSWVPAATRYSTSADSDDEQLKTSPRKKRKGKKGALRDRLSTDLLAMGTLQGSILLYSVSKGDLLSEMSGGHSEMVHDLCWHLQTDSIFSCSEDRRIVQWSPSKGKMKRQFKIDTGPIYAVVALPDGKSLLSAGKSIKWWDVERRELLKKFTGHASQIIQLSLVSFPDEPVGRGYVLSAASEDRHISVWQLESTQKSALVSFRLSDEPVSIDVSRPTSRNEKVRLSVITRGGVLHVFEHLLNGNVRKPLQPTVTLQMSLSNERGPSPIPVLSAQLCPDVDQSLLVAYGDLRRVGFEKLLHSSLKQHMSLVRSFSSATSRNADSKVGSKVRTPIVSKEVKTLAPGHLIGSRPSQVDPGGGGGGGGVVVKSKKRKFGDKSEDAVDSDTTTIVGINGEGRQLPMEDRLSALNLDLPAIAGSSNVSGVVVPQMDNMANLLLQGLHSRDENMLDRVFKLTNRSVIEKTVRRLPAKVVFVLLKELHRRIFGVPEQSLTLLWWLRSLLTNHTSYLSTCTELDVLLGPLYQLMDSRVMLFEKMSQLKGRMDLVVSQLSMKQETVPNTARALCVYQDESSDETDSYIDELLPSMSESEADNWDEFSEADEMECDEKMSDDDREDVEEEEEEEEEDEDEDDDDAESD